MEDVFVQAFYMVCGIRPHLSPTFLDFLESTYQRFSRYRDTVNRVMTRHPMEKPPVYLSYIDGLKKMVRNPKQVQQINQN